MTTRLLNFALSAAAFTVLLIAWLLDPDPSSAGTHRQLGFSACEVKEYLGFPCPTCGATTAFTFFVRGKLIAAFAAQPAATVLAALTATAAVFGALNVAIDVPLTSIFTKSRRRLLVVLAVLIAAAGWAYKIWVTI